VPFDPKGSVVEQVEEENEGTVCHSFTWKVTVKTEQMVVSRNCGVVIGEDI